MISPKKKYLIIAICLECNATMSTWVEVVPENLDSARLNFAKQMASVHTAHPDINNFVTNAEEIEVRSSRFNVKSGD